MFRRTCKEDDVVLPAFDEVRDDRLRADEPASLRGQARSRQDR